MLEAERSRKREPDDVANLPLATDGNVGRSGRRRRLRGSVDRHRRRARKPRGDAQVEGGLGRVAALRDRDANLLASSGVALLLQGVWARASQTSRRPGTSPPTGRSPKWPRQRRRLAWCRAWAMGRQARRRLCPAWARGRRARRRSDSLTAPCRSRWKAHRCLRRRRETIPPRTRRRDPRRPMRHRVWCPSVVHRCRCPHRRTGRCRNLVPSHRCCCRLPG